jgi:uncharacterized membrane protein YkoI
MKITKKLTITSAILLTLTSLAFAAPPTPEEAGKIALGRIPGTVAVTSQEGEGKPFEVTVLDKKGRECIVVITGTDGKITKVLTPRLTLKAVTDIAIKKVKGKSVNPNMSHYQKDGIHHITVNMKDDSEKNVQISDKTGKVIKVETPHDLG